MSLNKMFMLSAVSILLMTSATDAVKDRREQRRLVIQAAYECQIKINHTKKPDTSVYCDMVFDDVMCWDYTTAGVLATQSCPGYISGFNTAAFAKRRCMEDGKWYVDPVYNKTWTDFQPCTEHYDMRSHLLKISVLAKTGYSVSLAFLLFAICIMVYFRKLHCQRNTIHINLFLSCILRAGICLLKEFVIKEGIGLDMDIEYDEKGKVQFKEEGTHWQCKLFYTMFHYSLCTNYMWVFVEGLYLHNLIFFTVFSISKLYLVMYILLGWLSPILIIIPWVIVRVLKENTLCWNIHYTSYYWIMRGPIIASICINLFFFINIIRVLFTKLMTPVTREPTRYKYIRLAKSTLVLIPLFGVQYIVFVALIVELEPEKEVIKLYVEMILNSFQGAIVALLFCFLNGEVRAEIKKFWNNHMEGRPCARPSSRNLHTTSSFIGRDRFGSETNQNTVAMVEINADTTFKKNFETTNLNQNGSLNHTNQTTENTSLMEKNNKGNHRAPERPEDQLLLSN